MKRILTFLSIGIVLGGCVSYSANYIASSDIHKQRVDSKKVQVFYDNQEVPFKYKEIGRIFLKNIKRSTGHDPAGQINKIREQAAEYGADAVIISSEMRKESSFAMINGAAVAKAGDVFQYQGIAIIKK